jgi:hypothetical protein
MTDAEQEPEFDPATWTPDKPWPKGYYKPAWGAKAWMSRFDRAGDPGDGFRLFLWFLFGAASQILGFAAALAGRQDSYGLLHVIARTFTPWPLLVFFGLAVPSLLHAAIVAKPAMPFRRSLARGLLWSLALLALLVFVALLPPMLHVLFNFATAVLAR